MDGDKKEISLPETTLVGDTMNLVGPPLVLLCLCIRALTPIVSDPSVKPLTTTSAIRALPYPVAMRGLPVQLTATVTQTACKGCTVFIQDETGGTYVRLRGDETKHYEPGERLAVHGVTSAGQFGNCVVPSAIQVLGHDPALVALNLSLVEATKHAADSRYVSIPGTIHAVKRQNGMLLIRLHASGAQMTVVLRKEDESPPLPEFQPGRKMTARGIWLPRLLSLIPENELSTHMLLSRVSLCKTDEDSRKTTAVTTCISDLLSKPIEPDRPVLVRGTVRRKTAPNMLEIQDAGGRILVFPSKPTLARAGDAIECWGFPARIFGATVMVDTRAQLFASRFSESEEEGQGQFGNEKHPDQSLLLTSSYEVRRLTKQEAERGLPVRLTGVVTYYDARWNMLFVQDSTEGVFVEVTAESATELDACGQIVEVNGFSGSGLYAPVVKAQSIALRGRGTLPQPHEVTWQRFRSGEIDSQWLGFAGVIQEARSDGAHSILVLATPNGTLEVRIPSAETEATLSRLLDKRVRISGVPGIVINQRNQTLGHRLYCPSLAQISILNPTAEDPFGMQSVSIVDLMRLKSDGEVVRQQKTTGTVLYQPPNAREVFLRDSSGALRVLLREKQKVAVGDVVDALGYAMTGLLELELRHAEIRVVGRKEPPIPVVVSTSEVHSGFYSSDLIQMRAIVREIKQRGSSLTFLMQSGDRFFDAVIDSANLLDSASGFQPPSPETTLVVSGILDPELNADGEVTSFRLLLRSQEDLQVIESPPWWNLRNALTLLGGSAAVTMTILAWVLLLRVRIRGQTKVIEQRLVREANLETRYRNLVENAHDVVFTLDKCGLVTSFNRAGEEITGYRRDRVLGKPLIDVIGFATGTGEVPLFLLPGALGEVLRQEVLVKTQTGTMKTLEVSTVPLTHEGQADGLQGIARDITDRKKMEAQLRQASKMEAVGQLAGGVAHDFNNLLTVINGYSEMLLGQAGEGALDRELINEIRNAGERAASLTRRLLAFSRKQVLAPIDLNLNSIVEQMHNMLTRLIGEHITLRLHLDPELGYTSADPSQVEQVIMNLVVNARDAMPDGGELTITTENRKLEDHPEIPSGEYVLLSVRDTGIGMSKEVLARLFEPFFTTKPVDRGTGLGLATVYGIVKQSKGQIEVISEVGHGAKFLVYFQPVEGVTCLPRNETQTPFQVGGTETILLVEDDDHVRELARQWLTSVGYRVHVADRPANALARLEQWQGPLDLIVTDVVMPGMNGRQMMSIVHRTRPKLEVLYLSGYTDDSLLRIGFNENGIDFLPKPYTMDQLVHRVRAILDRPHVPSVDSAVMINLMPSNIEA